MSDDRPVRPNRELYLGDGAYASFDGFAFTYPGGEGE
jgi:hypothetical protein